MVELGKPYKDAITSFEGIAVARTEHLHGCVRICLESSTLGEGKPVEYWFDEQRLTPESTAPKGGPGAAPARRTSG